MKANYVLVLGASKHQLPTINYLKHKDIGVIVIDNITTSPGHKIADVSLVADTCDYQYALSIAQKYKAVGAISPCTDVAVPTAAYVNERINSNYKGVSYDTACILTSKILFRHAQQSKGLPHPKFIQVTDNAIPLLDFSQPWIIKPDKSSGSKGIFIIHNQSELRQRFNTSIASGLNRHVILEQQVQGHHGTIEGYIVNNEICAFYVLDRGTPKPPYVCTIGHRMPSILATEVQTILLESTQDFYRNLKLTMQCLILILFGQKIRWSY